MEPQIPDYYEILQVSRRADPIIIAKAFRLLAAFYHPDNRETGNDQMFREVMEGYRTLSDPLRRAAYDRAKFGTAAGTNGDGPALGNVSDGQPADECQLRRLILDALYDVRRSRPYKPALPAIAIAELFGRTMDELQFSFWYLRGKKWIEMPDGSDVAITVAGVDEVEARGLEAKRAADEQGSEMISLPQPLSPREADRGPDQERHRPSFAPWHEGASAMLPA